jgi:EamA domain-containing membrane protein RarD
MSPRSRFLLAVVAWCLAAVAVMLPLVWLINNRDWGVALMLAVPFVVYGLLRLGRVLEGWAQATPPPGRGNSQE